MRLKIATWNLERPRISSLRNLEVIDQLQKVDADILILTETNSAIHPGQQYHQVSTNSLSETESTLYHRGEIRTTIWSKRRAIQEAVTYDPNTSVCALIPTNFGDLTVYGTVIGVFGNRNPNFAADLDKQLSDWKHLEKLGPLCIAGDYNLSFSDPYYYTKAGRQLITDCFQELGIYNLTADIENNIDHIAISKAFVGSAQCETGVWNEDKKVSDHIGVWIVLSA